MTSAGGAQDERATRLPRRVALAAGLLLAVHALLIVLDARAMGRTADEANYFNSARVILRHGWVHESTLFQGPLALYANQLFVGGDFPAGGLRDFEAQRGLALRGRLGTLPFALLAAVLVFVWARRLFGDTGALLALLLHALDPVLLGYSSLMLVDAQHAALTLLVLYLLWRYVETRSARLVPWVGVTLGLALATKYLAVLLALPVGLTMAVVASSPRSSEERARVGRGLATLLAVAASALVTLHAAYLFRGGFAGRDPAHLRSALVREVVQYPVLGHAAALLPQPFLAGVDYQLGQSERDWKPFLNGSFAERQPATYLCALLYKTPEVALACVLLALVLGARRLWRDPPPGWRTAALATAPYALLLFGFLSISRMQLGIRYALPLYPLLFLATGALAWRAVARPPGVRAFALLALVGGLHAFELARAWPDWISYFNTVSGGERLAFRRFRDTNNDFGQHRADGVELLHARAGAFDVLEAGSGARFGRLAVDNDALKYQPDTRDGRTLTWLTWLEPIDHVGASWWLFELTPEAFERELAAHPQPELERDLSLAYLGAGQRADAERHLAALSDTLAAPLRRVIAAEDAVHAQPERAALEELIRAWLDVARPDRALAVVEEYAVEEHAAAEHAAAEHAPELADSDAAALARIETLEERRDYAGAAHALERRWSDPHFPARMRRVQDLRDAGDFETAAAVLAKVKHDLAGKPLTKALERIEHEIDLRTSFFELLR